MELREVKNVVARLDRENPSKKVVVNVSRVNRVGHSAKINCEVVIR